MARGINLSFVSDVRQLLRGTDQVQDALEDVGHALDGMAENSGQAESEMSSDFKAIADQANASAKSVATGYDDASDKARKSAGSIKEGFHGTGDELKAEGLSGAAAFDGSMDSAADSAQAFSSVALSAFGPIGAGIGIAAAAGFGAWRAQAQKAKEAIEKVFDALVDGQGRLNDTFREDKLSEWAKDGTLAKLARQADDLGVSYGTAVQAALGSAGAVAQVRDATDRLADSQTALTAQTARGAAASYAASRGHEALAETAEGAADQIGKAQDEYTLYTDAVKGAGIAVAGTTDKVDDNTTSLQDQASALLDARGQARDYQQALDDATKALKDNGATLDIHTQKGRDNQAALDNVANSILADGEVTKGERQHFIDLADAMGESEKAAKKLADQLKLLPDRTDLKVTATLDTRDLDRALDRLGDGHGNFRWDKP